MTLRALWATARLHLNPWAAAREARHQYARVQLGNLHLANANANLTNTLARSERVITEATAVITEATTAINELRKELEAADVANRNLGEANRVLARALNDATDGSPR